MKRSAEQELENKRVHKEAKRQGKAAKGAKKKQKRPIVICGAVPDKHEKNSLWRAAFYPEDRDQAWMILDLLRETDGEEHMYLLPRLFEEYDEDDPTHQHAWEWAKKEHDIELDETFNFKGITPDDEHYNFKEVVHEADLDTFLYTFYCRKTYTY